MDHALRKSVGPFSAGTRVKIHSDNHDGTVNIEVIVREPTGEKDDSYDFEDMVLDIEKSDLVQLRPRSENVHSTSRRAQDVFDRTL